MTKNTKILSSILITLCSLTLCSLLAVNAIADAFNENTVQIARFSAMDLSGWENKSFEGETQYVFTSENNDTYLSAKSMQSASALFKKIKINIDDTPFLNWSWRIDQALQGLNEKEKSGDDYAARIYVVFKTGYTPLSAKALNYVWSSNSAPDRHWPNAYTEKAIMIPLRSKQDKTGTWIHEKINIKQDLQKYFDNAPKHIDGIALMTDTDNSKSTASASYGDIYFSNK